MEDRYVRYRESSAISIETAGYKNDPKLIEISKHENVESDSVFIKPVYWKTKICSKWETTGQLPFCDHCHCAHGQLGKLILYSLFLC
uniref:Uncharacterized protein n=1 Tax=Solanum lycopersicum TaxID=4081 RepID=A0A3Q7J025_SOLLC